MSAGGLRLDGPEAAREELTSGVHAIVPGNLAESALVERISLDPNSLSYFCRGLDQKLVGVEETEPIRQIIV